MQLWPSFASSEWSFFCVMFLTSIDRLFSARSVWREEMDNGCWHICLGDDAHTLYYSKSSVHFFNWLYNRYEEQGSTDNILLAIKKGEPPEGKRVIHSIDDLLYDFVEKCLLPHVLLNVIYKLTDYTPICTRTFIPSILRGYIIERD